MEDKNIKKKDLSVDEKVVADQVADEILEIEDDDIDKKRFFLILLFLIGLIFLISSVSFSVLNSYYNGSNDNAVDVDVNVDVDNDIDKVNLTEEPVVKKKTQVIIAPDDIASEDEPVEPIEPVEPEEPVEPIIDPGTILFTFNEGSNYINMVDVYPTYDSVGKNLTKNNQYFDFNISSTFEENNIGTLVYEVSLIPTENNTIANKDIRVFLTENNKAVSITGKEVNSYSDLPNSSYREGGKVIYRKSVKGSQLSNFVFKMWLSSSASVGNVSKSFGCKIAIDAYYS